MASFSEQVRSGVRLLRGRVQMCDFLFIIPIVQGENRVESLVSFILWTPLVAFALFSFILFRGFKKYLL